jgi:hypothetical protein
MRTARLVHSIIWSTVGLCCIFLAFQVSGILQHSDTAIVTKAGKTLDSFSGVGPQIATTTKQVGDQASSTIAGVGETAQRVLSKTATTIDHINAPCPPNDSDKLHPCGLLADGAKTMNTLRHTIGQVEIAANHEDANLGKYDAQETQLYGDLHTTALHLDSSLDDLDDTLTTAHDLFANPNIPKMIDSGQLVMDNFGQMTTDGRLKFHAFLFPEPCKTKMCKVGRMWPYIKGGAEMVQPAYWFQQAWENRIP